MAHLLTRAQLLLPAAAVLAALAAYPLAPPINGDEVFWTRTGEQLATLAAGGDFSDAAWRTDNGGGYGYPTPTLGKVMIGASALTVDDGPWLFPAWRWSEPDRANIAANRGLPDAVLRAARWPSVVASAVAVLLVGLIAEAEAGAVAGAVAGAWMAAHPWMLDLGPMAMLDIPALALSLAAVYAGLRGLWLVSGLAAGLACAVKANAALTVVWLLLSGQFAAVGVACAAFVGVNPYVWQHGLYALHAMAAWGGSFQRAPDALSIVGRLVVGARVLLMDGPAPFVAALGLPFLRGAVARWAAVVTLGTVAWLPEDWHRWELPLVPVQALAVGLAAAYVAGSIRPQELPCLSR